MGMANNIEVKTIEDKTILDAAATLLKEDVTTLGLLSDPHGAIGASNSVYIVAHNGALNLITLRYRLKDSAIKAAKAAFKVGDREFAAGSFLIPASDRARREIEALGLQALAVQSAPADVQTFDVDLPRVAMYTTWSRTE